MKTEVHQYFAGAGLLNALGLMVCRGHGKKHPKRMGLTSEDALPI